MKYTNYTKDSFEKLAKQHNIMCLIGNGFDIQALQALGQRRTTSYPCFFNWLTENKDFNKENILYKTMKSEKEKGNEQWSDFELALSHLCAPGNDFQDYYNNIPKAYNQIRNNFAIYLNEIVTNDFLVKIGDRATENKLSVATLEYFLKDLDKEEYDKIKFPKKTKFYHLFNWVIFNFNFTTIFDNFVYLDMNQFDPHPHFKADTNFFFSPNPNNFQCSNFAKCNSDTRWSSYLLLDIIHPHGNLNVPKSILLGFDDLNSDTPNPRNFSRNYLKPYWNQEEKKYGEMFNETRLFIIYGLSMGKTDLWWWKHIASSLIKTKAELIIYFYTKELSKDTIRDIFIEASGLDVSDSKIKDKLYKKIFIVPFNDSNGTFAFRLK